ncbi:hypothetical protein SBA4_4600018 [Candidatus Sulfopaludibacter sp. SbA4]|nr:hypothetical protein SBA4_4600018 [Candidatus Sulfopaludibacter sp. SbA4]
MLVPETSVYKDYPPSSGERDIRFSRQASDVQAIAIPHPIEQPPDKKFRPRILRPDTAHQKTSLALSQPVHILLPSSSPFSTGWPF